jgi:hypothetical protein
MKHGLLDRFPRDGLLGRVLAGQGGAVGQLAAELEADGREPVLADPRLGRGQRAGQPAESLEQFRRVGVGEPDVKAARDPFGPAAAAATCPVPGRRLSQVAHELLRIDLCTQESRIAPEATIVADVR